MVDPSREQGNLLSDCADLFLKALDRFTHSKKQGP